MIVLLAANMPPTPWATETLTAGTCAAATPRTCLIDSCNATAKTPSSDAPAQRGRVHRRIPQSLRLAVEHRYGDRGAGHVEGGDIGTSQKTRRRDPRAVQNTLCAVDHQVELDSRSSARRFDGRNSSPVGDGQYGFLVLGHGVMSDL